MRQTFRDPELQAEFERRGFVVIPLLTTAEAAQYRTEIDGLLPPKPEINDAPGALYSTLFDPERREQGEQRTQAILEARLMSLLQDYKMQGSCVMAKVPHSGLMRQHQHNPMTDDMFEPVLHGWCTLDDVDGERGALRIVPGSHQILRHIQSFHSPPFFAGFQDRLETRFAETLPMRAGEAILFERTLLHGSTPNRSDRSSIRLFSVLLPTESRYCVLVPRGDDCYEAIETMADPSEFEPGVFCMAGGDLPDHRSAGILPSRNVQLTEEEFAELLRSGARVRPGFDPIDEIRARKPIRDLLSPMRRWWSRGRPQAESSHGVEHIEG
jgi:hypothetical protein